MNQILIQASDETFVINYEGKKGFRFTSVVNDVATIELVNVNMQGSGITINGLELGPFTITDAGGSRGTLDLQTGSLKMDYFYKISSPTLPSFVLNVKTIGVISPIADLRTYLYVNKTPPVHSNLFFFDYEFATGILPEFLPVFGLRPFVLFCMRKLPPPLALPPWISNITIVDYKKIIERNRYLVSPDVAYAVSITFMAPKDHKIRVNAVSVKGPEGTKAKVEMKEDWDTTHTVRVFITNEQRPFKKDEKIVIVYNVESTHPDRINFIYDKTIELKVDP